MPQSPPREATHEPTGARDRDRARALICDELAQGRRGRRRRFLPVLLLLLTALAGAGALAGVRADLLDQPGWQVASQLAAWALGLVVLPGIGLGLFFPRRAWRIALAAGAPVLAVAAALHWPIDATPRSAPTAGCAALLAAAVALMLLVGLASGAFTQRLRPASALWLTSAIALTALDAITWHCPLLDFEHVCTSHLGAALALLVVASALGLHLRRRAARAAR